MKGPSPSRPGSGRIREILAPAAIRGGLLLLALAGAHYASGYLAQRSARAAQPAPGAASRRPSEGDLVARLSIPKIRADLAVFEGVSDAVLRRGPGHLPGTALPDGSAPPGNCVIAAHRDSFFRRLGRLRKGDAITLRAGSRETAYRISRRSVVEPTATAVADPAGPARLTLVTCYPLDWIGPAPYRLVLEAEPADPRGEPAGRANGRTEPSRSEDSMSPPGDAGLRTKRTDSARAAKTSVM